MATKRVLRPRVQVAVPALACIVLVMLLVVPLPELQLTPQSYLKSAARLNLTLTSVGNTASDGSTPACEGAGIPPEALQTCGGRKLEAGYVLALKNWEQQTAGSANLMSLQCWAATLRLVVVEDFIITSEFRVPDELIVNASTATPNKFVRLHQLYDIGNWNSYSRDECYAPLVKWEEFLCNAPRQVILVHIAYKQSNVSGELRGCPPEHEYNKTFTHKLSRFLQFHSFKINREVCLVTNNEWSTRTFNSLIVGNMTSTATVIINLWKGIGTTTTTTGNRIFLTDTRCDRNNFFLQSFNRPSTKLLKDVRLYREQILKNKDYIAVMVRLEFLARELIQKDSWSASQCLNGVLSILNQVANDNALEKTFWSWDVGRYGSVAYSRSEKMLQFGQEMFKLAKQHHNITYSEVEENLTRVSGTTNEGYIASLQLNIAVRAKCLVLIGGGSFQEHASGIFRSLHQETSCIITKGIGWLKRQCS